MAGINVLMVEDNEGDIFLAKEAVDELHLHIHLDVVHDGEEAIRYLRKKGEFSNITVPDLILLDINIPKIGGLDVLKIIKQNLKIQKVPVVVFSTSTSPKDVNKAYSLHANCYIEKPDDAEQFAEIMRAIGWYWGELSTLPN